MLAVDACKEFKEFKKFTETEVWVCVEVFQLLRLLGWIGVC